MQRPLILILPFHGIGHYNALFGVARALEKTHNVIFAGAGYFHKHVVSRGFRYVILRSYPFGIGLESWINEGRKYPKLRTIVDRWKDRLYYERKTELTKLLEELKPVHVMIDTQQATDLIVVRSIDPDLKVSIISVAPPYLLLPGLPPINSLAMPGEDVMTETLNNLSKKKWRYWRKFLGMDDWTIVDRRLRRNKMTDLKDDHPSLMQFAPKGVDQYVLTYKEYDFHHPYLDNFKYVGPHIDPDYTEPNSENYSKPAGKKLIYCSFGTVPSKKNIDAFISKLNEAIKDLDCELIVGSSKHWVPQLKVLSYADVFITHGGINSVHDAIRHKVPMIVYPLDNNYDQKGNSSRVVYHGFGLRGDFDTDTPEDIRSKLVEIFTDIRFREKLDTFDISHYTVDKFVKMITS